MTMIIRLDMSLEQAEQLRESMADHDQEKVERLLARILAPTVEEMLRQQSGVPEYDEFEQLLDLLETSGAPNEPMLSDYAVTRSSIYEDEPR